MAILYSKILNKRVLTLERGVILLDRERSIAAYEDGHLTGLKDPQQHHQQQQQGAQRSMRLRVLGVIETRYASIIRMRDRGVSGRGNSARRPPAPVQLYKGNNYDTNEYFFYQQVSSFHSSPSIQSLSSQIYSLFTLVQNSSTTNESKRRADGRVPEGDTKRKRR